jgi:SH3-like domain-containing protein
MKIFINLIVAVFLLLPQGAYALCVQGDCHDGQGTVVLPDGRRYVGEFQDGIRTGRGLMTFPDGTKYLGDWQSDKPHGQGTLSSMGKFEYAGEFANGVREGQGTLETVDGKKYIGQWQNDVPHGQGKIIYPDGTVFVGQFENGRRNGQGENTYKDGTIYTGHWKEDLPNGLGTKIYADGEKYTGQFRNGLMHGLGTVVKPDGSSYAGQWQNDVLVKKEEVVTESEFSAAEETEGHVLSVVDEKSSEAPMTIEVSEDSVEPTPVVPVVDSPTVEITNPQAGYASVNQKGVFVRSGPSTEYRVIRSVSRGFPVQVIGQQDKWSNIKDSVGQEGWIYSPLLGMNNSVIVNASKVNLRSGPGLNFKIVSQADFGAVLLVNNIQGDWYKVTTSRGIEGWLSRNFIWPVGHVAVSSQGVSESVQISSREDMQAVQAVEPVTQEDVDDVAAMVQVDTPKKESEPVAEMLDVKVEPEEVAAVIIETDEKTETAPVAIETEPEAIPVESETDKEYAGVVQNGKGANIRSEPSLAAEVLRSVPPGFPMVVLERQGDWALVEDFRERQGWVYSTLLTDLGTVVIKVGKGNLRSGPNLTEDIVSKLDYSIVMFVDEKRGDWIKVSNPEGLVGWLHHDVVWP